MHITKSNQPKREVLRVILDEPRLYVEESLGSVMVRGEVIVNFAKDTPIQGPIELLFEGIQRYQNWPDIMPQRSNGPPIETKLQVTELTLLPPNGKGFMPAGIQRFPFEFPIPASLPTTVYIKDRIEIFYQLSATIYRSATSTTGSRESISGINWMDWTRIPGASNKKKYVACSPIRIVRAVESIVSNGLPAPATTTTVLNTVVSTNNSESENSSSAAPPVISEVLPAIEQPWNRRGLNEYQSALDEQHDQLAFSLSGRTNNNLHQTCLESTHGIRYKLGFDRTAIAIGTSVGIELMIEPTYAAATIKSVTLKISENRKYAMKIPAGYNWATTFPTTRRYDEGIKMVLKWAYGFQVDQEEAEAEKRINGTPGIKKYVRQRTSNGQDLAYFDPPQAGSSSIKTFLGECHKPKQEQFSSSNIECVQEPTIDEGSREMMNLKELNQKVNLGEYFGGRFVMPVPDCSNLLNPSMAYESININHWVQLIVTIQCDGKTFDLMLESPARMLDCRCVSDDDYQTLLPPPPTYQPGDGSSYGDTWSTGTFWEQREAITLVSGWGSCVPCPCQHKKIKKLKEERAAALATKKKGSPPNNHSSLPPNHLPEWGPPPCYSEN